MFASTKVFLDLPMTAADRTRAWWRAQRSDAEPLGAYWAPGRINLIGDHIDYLGGTVLPMTLDRGTAVLVLPRTDRQLHVHALDVDEHACFGQRPLEDESTLPQGNWRDFVTGLLRLDDLQPSEPAQGLDLVVSGDLEGGGLSSSASFTLALALSLMANGWLRFRGGIELARFAQAVEVQHVGTNCGLMDQLVIVNGSFKGAVAIDCGGEAVTEIAVDWQDRELLVMHCGEPRRLADAAYNQRRSELSRGLLALGESDQSIPDRSSATIEAAMAATLGEGAAARRVRHVISEQQRVLAARKALDRQDWPGLGAAMTASHVSLRDDFEVSVPALDALVEAVVHTPGCDGARMTGAGFGGWAIALVERHAREAVLTAAAAAIQRPLSGLDHFIARPGGPARALGTCS